MTIEQIRLKEARQAKGLSQRDVAALLEISQPAYQKLENGQTTDMRISTLKRICKALDISADWLLGLTEEASEGIPNITVALEAMQLEVQHFVGKRSKTGGE